MDETQPITAADIRKVHPIKENVVRAASPFGQKYLKPLNGIQTKGFARSAQRRTSVLTLGSIERLQHFYAKRDLKKNKGGTLGFKTLTEEPDDFQDNLPIPKAPLPSWMDLNVETDLDVLLDTCFIDIKTTLTAWENPSLQIISLIQSVTKMLDSVRNYTMHRHNLSDSALANLRRVSLDLLKEMKDLECRNRQDGNDQEGYMYKPLEFNQFQKERAVIYTYLRVVESHGLNPPHHIGSPPAVFPPDIQVLLGKPSILSDSLPSKQFPLWLQHDSFPNNPIGKCHAVFVDNQDQNSLGHIDIPNPTENEDAFLESLAQVSPFSIYI